MNEHKTSPAIAISILAIGICIVWTQALSAQQTEAPSIGQYIEVADNPGGELRRVPDPQSFHAEIVNFQDVTSNAAHHRVISKSEAWSRAKKIAERLVTNGQMTEGAEGAISDFPLADYTMIIAAKPPRINLVKKAIRVWAQSDMTVDQIVAKWNAQHRALVDIQTAIFQIPLEKLDEFKRVLTENNIKTHSPERGPITMLAEKVDSDLVKQLAEQTKVDLVSSPRLVVLMGTSAQIMTGAEIPMVTEPENEDKPGDVVLKHLGTKIEVMPVAQPNDSENLILNLALHDQLLMNQPDKVKPQPGFWSRGIQTGFIVAPDQTVMLMFETKDVSDPKKSADQAKDVVKAVLFTANRKTETSMPRR